MRIEVLEPALTTLQRENRTYVRATFKEGDRTYVDVGVHLKGMGSFRPLGEKPSFVVKFDRYTPSQTYEGLHKFMLNNASQDGTYLAEWMATQMFRDAGVPAARVTHTFVELNGRPLGLYVLIEAMNRDFLKQHFPNSKGNLYEAYLADIDSVMDQDGGVDTSQSDRKRLVEIARLADAGERWRRLHEVFEVDQYLSHLTVELFTSHVDGYAFNRNNYRLYHDPSTDRFSIIAHGIDWAYAQTGLSMQPPRGSILTKAVLQTPEGWRQFKERRAQLFTNVFKLEVLTNRLNSAVARLKAAARNPGEAKEFENGGNEMRTRLIARAKSISDQLAAPEPLPVHFDSQGIARLGAWQFKEGKGQMISEKAKLDDKSTLHLRVQSGECIGSFRTKVLLDPGHYQFQALARTAHIESLTNKVELGNGAGIRISGGKRTEQLVGTADWTKVEYDFEVQGGGEEKELVCELRALQGEVWFDLGSLQLKRRRD